MSSSFQLDSDQSSPIRRQYPSSINCPKVFENDAFHRKYDELEILGEGGAAVVKKCMNKATGKYFACKKMRNYDIEKEMSSKSEFTLIQSLKECKHII